jgi:hypothetical protein
VRRDILLLRVTTGCGKGLLMRVHGYTFRCVMMVNGTCDVILTLFFAPKRRKCLKISIKNAIY